MKKIILMFGLMLSMVACTGNSTQNSNADLTDTIIVDTIQMDSLVLVDTLDID